MRTYLWLPLPQLVLGQLFLQIDAVGLVDVHLVLAGVAPRQADIVGPDAPVRGQHPGLRPALPVARVQPGRLRVLAQRVQAEARGRMLDLQVK